MIHHEEANRSSIGAAKSREIGKQAEDRPRLFLMADMAVINGKRL
jgi:hypothetical protein